MRSMDDRVIYVIAACSGAMTVVAFLILWNL